jgi:hypothetical protein
MSPSYELGAYNSPVASLKAASMHALRRKISSIAQKQRVDAGATSRLAPFCEHSRTNAPSSVMHQQTVGTADPDVRRVEREPAV